MQSGGVAVNIDYIFGKMKIQTKVLIFVVPFVASICLVGAIGLVSSVILQSRIEVSNGVVSTLSGFKELSASIDSFLSNSSQDSFKEVTHRVSLQQDAISHAAGGAGDAQPGSGELKTAAVGTGVILEKTTALWQLHQQDEQLRKAFDTSLKVLMGAEITMGEKVTQLQRSARKSQEQAAEHVITANMLFDYASVLKNLSGGYGKLADPSQKLDFIHANAGEIEQRSYGLSAARDGRYKALGAELSSISAALMRASDTSTVDQKTGDLGPLTNTLADFAQGELDQGASALSANAKKAIEAENIATAGHGLSNSIYYIQIVAASFLEEPNQERHNRLVVKLQDARKSLEALNKSVATATGVIQSPLVLKAIEQLESGSADLTTANSSRLSNHADVAGQIDSAWQALSRFAELQKKIAEDEGHSANRYSVTATAVGICAAIAGAILMIFTLKNPIIRITHAMRRLADGVLDTAVVGETRTDEIGEMARALTIFKSNAQSKKLVEMESEEQRRVVEIERAAHEGDKKRLDEQIQFAVAELGKGLGRLARGDLSREIETPFVGQLEQLRLDFNDSMARLNSTMFEIRSNALAIQQSGGELQVAAESLAQRTEAQTVELKGVAGAVEWITAKVRSSAKRAHEANHAVTETSKCAGSSVAVVASAMEGMARIESASREIQKIIEVIDEIAFQTNLLALNAGIEAARAGDAGKGFAVVAHEVRELSQNSASAARQIKSLIDKSSQEVGSGSKLISETKLVLDSINGHVQLVSGHVDDIAISSREQAISIGDVNSSVAQLGHMTQQNRLMVDRTTLESRALADRADGLMDLVERFRLAQGAEDDSEIPSSDHHIDAALPLRA
jgi:methyl-accepting chemotaxis protein